MLRVVASFSLAGILLLSGCSNGIGPETQSTTLLPAVVHGTQGMVHGGQQPVSGATITLWAVGTTGYGSTASALTTTTTLADGSFSITGSYTCPAADPYVYITAVGGNPGLTAGTNNSALWLVAALSDCNTLKTNAATTFITINEVTTVAAAYALGQFMNPITGYIGAYSYANTGLANGFATVNNLVNTSTGAALATTPNGNGVVPQLELNTLADILAPCVNSTSQSSSACTTLFGALLPNQSIPPFDTLVAALSMSQHPGYNATTLFGLAGATPPFQPTLPSAPNDWTVALSFNGNASNPRAIAIDGLGQVWTANFAAGGATSRLSKLSPLGVPLSGSPFGLSLNGTNALAIDTANEVWVGNTGDGTLVGFANTGNTFAGPITGLSVPTGMAFDASGHLWITNFGNSSVAEFSPNSFSFISPTGGYTGGGLTSPGGIAIDSLGNAWVSNASTVTELNSAGVVSSNSPLSNGGISSPAGIAIDGSNNVWITNALTGSVAALSNSGTAVSGSPFANGGASSSTAVAIDGGGDVWIADKTLNQLAELSSTGAGISLSTGYRGGSMNTPTALAIDGSGNVWVANQVSTTTGSITTTISEFVGAAVPAVAPLETALVLGQVGVKPGSPLPITIESGVLPYFAPSSSYSAQLYAIGGNTGTYTWSIASGALPSPLALSSTGLISGTTALTGTYTVTVKAADAGNTSNFTTRTLTLTANSTLPVGGNESALNGSYALSIGGFQNGLTSGGVTGSDLVGSMTFNGSGTITGEVDGNTAKTGTLASTAITGFYSYGADNRGTLVLIPTAVGTKPREFAFAGGTFSGSTPQTLRLIEFDDTNPSIVGTTSTGAGVAKLQTSSAFSATTLGQSFVFGMQGETPCNNCNGTITPFGPLSAAGKFTANTSGSVTFGEEDVAGVSTTYNSISLAGSYTNPDASGRGTLTLTPSGTLYPAPPSHFVYYIVNSGELFVMSSDGHTTTSMLSGDALVQTGTFSSSTISGNYIAYENSGSNGDGVSSYPTSSDASVIFLAVQPGSQIVAQIDENNGQGGVKLEKSQGTLSYAIDSNGRMTLTGGDGVPVFYLANSGQFFGTEQPSASNQGGPGMITGVQQTSVGSGCGSNTGIFVVGTLQSPIASSVNSGVVNLSTNVITDDQSSPVGVMQQGLTGTVTCTPDSVTATTGRVVFTASFGTTEAAYPVVPNSKYVLVSISPTDGQPYIITVEK